MRRRCLVLLVVPLLVVGGLRSSAADDEPTPSTRADAIVKALAGEDKAALARLAGADHPDPWRVMESLLVRGLRTAATKYAAAATAEGTQGLAAYATSAAEAAARDGKAGVSQVEDTFREAQRLAGERSWVAAQAAFERAAREAEAVGWLTQASEAHYQAGLALYEQSDYAGARVRFGRHLATEVRLGSAMGQGRGNFRMGTTSATLGEPKQARAYLEASRRFAEKARDTYYLGKIDSEEGVGKIHAGDARLGMADLERARALFAAYDPARVPYRFRLPRETIARAHVGLLLNLASTTAALGEEAAGRVLAREAVRAARVCTDKHTLLNARAFLATLEAVLSESKGEHLAALGQFSHAEELYRRLGIPAEHANALRRLARMKSRLSDLPNALADVEQAIRVLKPTGDKRKLFSAHVVAGDICAQLARYALAQTHRRVAKRLAQELEDPQFQITALLGLGRGAHLQARFGEGLRLMQEAREIHASHPHTQIGAVDFEIASLYLQLGDAAGGLKRTRELLAGMDPAKDLWLVLGARSLAGSCLWRLDRLEEALAEFEAVYRAHQKGGNRVGEVDTLVKIVTLYLVLYRFDEAIAAAQRGIGLARVSSDRTDEVRMRLLLGRSLVWNKEVERGLEELEFAGEIAEELDDLPLRARVLAGLAEAHFLREEYPAAVARAREGLELGATYGFDLSEASRAQARDRLNWCAQWGTAAAVAGYMGPETYYFLERMRAQSVIVSLGGREHLRNAQVPRALRLAQDAARAKAALAYEGWVVAKRRRDRTETRAARDLYNEALSEERNAVRAIQQAVRSQAKFRDGAYVRTLTADEAQALCGEGDALVIYGHDGFRYVAAIFTRDTGVTRRLGWIRDVDKAMEELFRASDDKRSADALRDLIYKPLRLPASVKRVIISPAGKMAYAPFAALDRGREFCMVPSATAWAALRSMKVEGGTEVLALADPAYGLHVERPRSIASAHRGGNFAPLPATRKEVEGIGGDTVLLGTDATETRLREILGSKKRWRSIHLACHGVVDDLIPTRSALVLAPDKHNDGFLHADEIHDQIEFSTDLVVLSACETGRGRIYGGEGLIGLSRAFMLAGAPRVLCSLWKVDDEATSVLMVKFYELWHPRPKAGDVAKAPAGLSATKALRLAQEHVRSQKKWAHPYYWAAWVLWGLPD